MCSFITGDVHLQMADLYGLKACPVGGGEIRGAGSLWICPEVWIVFIINFGLKWFDDIITLLFSLIIALTSFLFGMISSFILDVRKVFLLIINFV